jgi:hypothetical protein
MTLGTQNNKNLNFEAHGTGKVQATSKFWANNGLEVAGGNANFQLPIVMNGGTNPGRTITTASTGQRLTIAPKGPLYMTAPSFWIESTDATQNPGIYMNTPEGSNTDISGEVTGIGGRTGLDLGSYGGKVTISTGIGAGNGPIELKTLALNNNITLTCHGSGKVIIGNPLTVGAINSSADALPVASVTYRGQFRIVEGGAGARDRNYLCMKSDAGAYSWVEVANGGA